MATAAAKNGAGPTALVAIEHYYPEEERIIEDNLAYRILPFSVRVFVRLAWPGWVRAWMVRATEKTAPGLWSGLLCRKRYIDEKLTDSVNQIDAIINLGAGFDTRVYRLPSLSTLPVWEVDHDTNITRKRTHLRTIFGTIPSRVKLVAIDFEREDLRTVLELNDYSTTQRTFFILEGVTQYLTEEGVRATFTFLASAASGSRLVFTYVRKDFLEGRALYGWEKIYKQYVTTKIWLFGMEPEAWPDFLKAYGWNVVEDIGYDELAEEYVKPTGRKLASTPVERLIYAEKV